MIDAQRVEEIMKDSLYREEELPPNIRAQEELLDLPAVPPTDAIVVKGLVSNYGFHPERLKSHQAEIKAMIEDLPKEFLRETGGGYTFLNLCTEKDGRMWGQHRDCENLLCLAMGLKMAGYCAPREMWQILPGGVPYIWFSLEPVEVKEAAA